MILHLLIQITLMDRGIYPVLLCSLANLNRAQLSRKRVQLAYSTASVKRAVQRGELPPPCRLFGGNAWTAGAIVQHIEKRLDQAAQEAKREADKIARLSP